MSLQSTYQYFSLWLEPAGDNRKILEQVIHNLAQEFGGPVFTPHLTLIPDRPGTPEQIKILTQKVADQISFPLELKFDQISSGTTRFQCVYLKAEMTSTLNQANQNARQIFQAQDLPQFLPHLSLFYADVNNQPDDEKTRSKIASRAAELLSDLLPLNFSCQGITIYTSGEDVASWHQIAELK